MNALDKFVSVAVLGVLAPAALALAAWWGGYLLFKEIDSAMPYLITAGIAAGVILDVTVLRAFILNLFSLPLPALFALQAFYSVMAFGVFMGMPIPSAFTGIAVSYVIIKKAYYSKQLKEDMLLNARKAGAFSFFLLFLLCVFSAVLALTEPTICSQMKMMLGLPFMVEMWMIWLIIILGGAILLVVQYAASRLVIKAGLKRL